MKSLRKSQIFKWLTNHKIATALGSLAAIAALILFVPQAWQEFSANNGANGRVISGNIHQTTGSSGQNIIVQGDFNGFTLQQFEEFLTKRSKELTTELAVAREKTRRRTLESELQGVQEKLLDINAAYIKEKALHKAAAESLEKLKGELPESKIRKGQLSLRQGDTRTAEALFDQVVKGNTPSVALAAYESGKLGGRPD